MADVFGAALLVAEAPVVGVLSTSEQLRSERSAQLHI